ncbi:MAG: hypothetical protein KKF50_03360 [Nanoarchaeota archaeon]|nr:hypothetical protein [Nanoarchaeota archaeon]
MALNFHLTCFEKQEKGYLAREREFEGDYWVRGRFLVYGNPDGLIELMICTPNEGIPTKEETEEMCISVKGLTPKAMSSEEAFEKGLVYFISHQ